MKNINKVIISSLIVCAFTANISFSDTVDSIISNNVVLPPGLHNIVSNVHILPGASLTFSSTSTVQIERTTGSFRVDGSLHVNDTLIMGKNELTPWGWIFADSGCTVSLQNSTFHRGSSASDWLPSNAVVIASDCTLFVTNCTFSIPRKSSIKAKGASNCRLYDNRLECAGAAGEHYSALIFEYQKSKSLQFDISGNTYPDNGERAYGISNVALMGFIDQPTILPVFNDDIYVIRGLSVSNTSLIIPQVPLFTVIARDKESVQITGIDMYQGSALHACGTINIPIHITSHYSPDWSKQFETLWRDITFHSGSTGFFKYVHISRAGRDSGRNIGIDHAFLSISNSLISPGYLYGIKVENEGVLECVNVTITNFNRGAIVLELNSHGLFRNCDFSKNNTLDPLSYAVQTDDSSTADARYCWWGDSSGPFPYGSGDKITTNGIMVFPWLLAAPGSQTNPPSISITSHSGEPIVVSSPQILLKGIVTDNSKITRVEFRNLSREIIGEASVSGTNWQANIWLFNGVNYIGLTAYDDDGNVTVLGTIVDCTGGGCGDGGETTPSLIPIPDRTIEAGQLFELAVSAVSPTEPSVLTYWAANLPDDAEFDPFVQKFSWIPAIEGVYSNIIFCVTDGTHIDTNKLTLTVTSTPSVNILSVDLPDAYVGYPYYFHLSDDSINGPVTWEIENADMPPGLFASRSGIICGTPYNSLFEETVNFTAKAVSADGIESKTKQFSLHIDISEPSTLFKIFTQSIPYKLNGAEYDVQLVATNGSSPYTWVDIAGMLQSASGLSVSSNGLLSGTANANGIVPATWYVEDINNKSTYATIPVPVIKSEAYLLELDNGNNKCKIIIKRVPGKTYKCKMMVTAFLNLPESFEIDENSIVTLKVGYGFIDAQLPSQKYVPEKKLLYKKKVELQSSKILVKKLPDGRISAKFVIKNVDYNNTFYEFGIVDETLKSGQVILPFWIRIGDYCTETTDITVTVKSKAGKSTKCNAKW